MNLKALDAAQGKTQIKIKISINIKIWLFPAPPIFLQIPTRIE